MRARSLAQQLAFCLLLSGLSNPALADAWSWGSNASVSSNYSDNPTLRSDDQEKTSLFRFLAKYQMDISKRSSSTSFNLRPYITRDYYPDRDYSELEDTGLFLNGSWSHSRQLTTWGLNFNVSRQNILSNENSVAESGSGVNQFRANDRQFSYGFGPSFSWIPTNHDQITLSANIRKTDFDLDYTGRSDFTSNTISASYRRMINERHSAGFTGNFSNFDSDGINCRVNFNPNTNPPSVDPCIDTNNPNVVNARNSSESESSSLTFDYRYDWSETTVFTALIGLQSSDNTLSVLDANGDSLLYNQQTNTVIDQADSTFESTAYNIALKRDLQRSDFTLRGTRSVVPSSTGTAQDRYELTFIGNYKFSSKFSGRLNLTAWEQQSVFLAEGVDDAAGEEIERQTRYFSSALSFSWALSRKLSFNGRYTYRWRDRDIPNSSETVTSTGNQYAFGVTYVFREKR